MHRLPSAAPSSTLPSLSTITGWTPKNGIVAEPGLVGMAPGSGVIRMPPVSVCHQVSTIGQRPSPTTRWYHSQASGLIGSPTEPSRRSDCAAGLLHRRFALAHQRADRGRRGVEDVDLVLVDDLPEARDVGIVRHALEHQRGRAVGERAVDDVAVPGDPADIGRAPVDVAVVVVEDVLVRHRRVDEVAAGRVQHALRLAGRARGVEDEQRVFRVHLLRRAVGRHLGDLLVVPDVAALRPSRPGRRCAGRRCTFLTLGQFFSASSALALSGTLLPPRRPSSAVMTKLESQSWMRPPGESGEKPPNTTEWTAPMRAQASIA